MTSGRLSVSVGTSFSRSVADLPDQEPRRPDWILRQHDLPYEFAMHSALRSRSEAHRIPTRRHDRVLVKRI